MGKKWYIVHTYSGQEARAKQSLIERATALGFEESFDEVLIQLQRSADGSRDLRDF